MATASDVHWESWRRLRDPAAFEALVRPELGRALSFARSLGCSDADAEDVLQESLVRLAAERSDRPSRVGVRAWLYRTVRDRARSRRRSWWRRRSREARAARPEAAPARTGALEVREQVEQALAALPEAEREAVRLRYLQDLDYRDMAHVLGVSENACRIRVHRALEALKKFEKDHVISQDEHRKFSDEIQKMTDQYVTKVDEALKSKESEITQV